MRSFRWLLPIVFIAASYGCTTPSLGIKEPYAVTADKMSQVDKGMGKQRILELFGEPEMVAPTYGGEVYFFKDLNLNSVWVEFDQRGVVTDYEWSY